MGGSFDYNKLNDVAQQIVKVATADPRLQHVVRRPSRRATGDGHRRPAAIVSGTVTKSHDRETSEVVVASAAKVTVEKASGESSSWEQNIQLRLMELDVDPGNDAGEDVSKQPGN